MKITTLCLKTTIMQNDETLAAEEKKSFHGKLG